MFIGTFSGIERFHIEDCELISSCIRRVPREIDPINVVSLANLYLAWLSLSILLHHYFAFSFFSLPRYVPLAEEEEIVSPSNASAYPSSTSPMLSQPPGNGVAEIIPSILPAVSQPPGTSVVGATPCRLAGKRTRKRPLQDLEDTIVLDSSPETVDLTQSW